MNVKVLRVYHYGETADEDRRFTISPNQIAAVAVVPEDVTVRGRKLARTMVLMMDGTNIEITLTHDDVETLETAIGMYVLPTDEM